MSRFSHRVRGGGPSINDRSAGFRSVASIIMVLSIVHLYVCSLIVIVGMHGQWINSGDGGV